MEFMDLLKEWLYLRDRDSNPDDFRSIDARCRDSDRMREIEDEINRRMRGEP